MLRNGLKRTISTSSTLEQLQMVSELDIGRCASKDTEPQRGVDTGQCASEDAGSRRGWIVRSHISWRGERKILYKDVETSP